MSRTSKSPQRFINRVERKTGRFTSRFAPGRGVLPRAKPTMSEKLEIATPPQPGQ